MLQSQIARLLEAGAVVVEVGNGGERISGSTQHGSSENHSPLMHVSSSISPAVRMSRNISQPVVTCVEVCSSGSGSGSENGNGCVAGGASESVYSVTGTRGSLERNLSESSDGIQPMVSAAQFAKTTPNLSNVSGQPGGPCVFDSQVNKAPTRMERLHVSRSMESYPGRYPVSDHLDYSSLATPVSQMRGRGTTSVRPFSEV